MLLPPPLSRQLFGLILAPYPPPPPKSWITLSLPPLRYLIKNSSQQDTAERSPRPPSKPPPPRIPGTAKNRMLRRTREGGPGRGAMIRRRRSWRRSDPTMQGSTWLQPRYVRLAGKSSTRPGLPSRPRSVRPDAKHFTARGIVSVSVCVRKNLRRKGLYTMR